MLNIEPLPGKGATAERLWQLAELGRQDPVAARLGEGHADAVAIRAELGDDGPPATGRRWGVWAAVPQSLRAVETAEGWRISGERPWCSGAGWCTHALVTAEAPDGIRLFAIVNEPPWAVPLGGTWPAVGMAASDSRTIRFTDAPGRPVGGPGDYVHRPGFWHGGIGVAACWYGGALGLADLLREKADGPHALAHLGAVDVALGAARAVLAEAAAAIDADPTAVQHRLALRVRATVEAAATEVIDRVGRALGAGPLCRDERHARRVADLTVYLRQSHAEADLEQLGRLVQEEAPW
ncbi:acyl-CoA dehydrogenase [Paractinoplanes abujensis]|uniref:Alkylation response protein AidB-like acyl-CoA dehydrogenase n=1 Tax=Paractinoplanes abujensis TaxID=882441 RepID=A0A7W7G385_9ACTN|nr:acyl-CoA dehydrogenase [Actinoplanes abujensis]MBB4693925.1 alkylation response protein AidB-like acyl-CoA dehydrogenase [Actinoplanes abujensis]GID21419.1 acyl-CoA dehydrogenase [Actinoplanes abujensis]